MNIDTVKTTDHKDKAKRLYEEIFPKADIAALDDVIAPDGVGHEAPPGTPPGPAGVARTIGWLHSCFSDQRWEVHQAVSEDDTVMLYMTHSGTHTGEFMGIPPTDRHFEYRMVQILRFENGLAAEAWGVRDDATFMRQITE